MSDIEDPNDSQYYEDIERLSKRSETNLEQIAAETSEKALTDALDEIFTASDSWQLQRDELEWWTVFNTMVSKSAREECQAEMELGRKSGWRWRLLAKPSDVSTLFQSS